MPDFPDALLRGRDALAKNDKKTAREAFEEAARSEDPAVRLEASRTLAQLLREAGEPAAAVRAAREALAGDPEDDATFGLLAQAEEDLGNDVGASEALATLAGRHPQSSKLREKAEHAAHRARGALASRAIGQHVDLLLQSRLLVDGHFATTASGPERRVWKNAFAEIAALLGEEGAMRGLVLTFDDAAASRTRRTNPWGAAEMFGNLPLKLDEYTAAGMIFLATALGLAAERARALLGELDKGQGALAVNRCTAAVERNGHMAIAVRSA